jgi:alpha-1,6-mannosyltransferase
VQSYLSISTSLAVGAGQIGVLLGLGDHTAGTIAVMQPFGTLVGAALAILVMWRCWQRHLEPIQGLGIALGAFVLLSPVIQPWYLLWAALPLAVSTSFSGYRRATVWLTAIFAVIIMPNGATIPVFTIVQAVLVAAMVVGGVLLWLRRSGLPQTHPLAGGIVHPVASVRVQETQTAETANTRMAIGDAVIGVAPDGADPTRSAPDPYSREA